MSTHETSAPGVVAARVFNKVALQCLGEREERCSQRHVAEIVGEYPTNYSAALTGRFSVSVDRVVRWIEKWEAAGYPHLVLRLSSSVVDIKQAGAAGFYREPLPSGLMMSWLDPGAIQVDSVDLFVGVSRKRRYGGFLDVTVLHHLALGTELAKATMPGDRLVAGYFAAHDLHEAYVGEFPRGLKLTVPELRLLVEDPWEAHVHRGIGLRWPVPEEVSEAVGAVDSRVVALEAWSVGGQDWQHLGHFFDHCGGQLSSPEQTLALQVLELSDAARWRIVAEAVNGAGGRLPVEIDGRATNPVRVGLPGRRTSEAG